MLRTFNRIAFASSFAVLCFAATGVFAVEDWKFYTYVPNTRLATGAGVERMVNRINAETGGAVKVTLHMGGSLPIKATDNVQAVGDNVVQMGADGFFAGHVPIASIMRMPLMIQSAAEYERAMRIARPKVDAAFDKLGIKLLGYYTYAPVTLFANKPLAKLADLNGMKIRQGGPESAEFLKSYGASPITMGTSDVASALQQGVIQGVVTASAGGGSLWKGQLTHNYRIEMYTPESWIFVNKAAFNKLPASARAQIEKIVAEEGARTSKEAEAAEGTAIAEQKAGGMAISSASAGDLKDAQAKMVSYWASWAKSRGAEGEALLAEVRKAVGR